MLLQRLSTHATAIPRTRHAATRTSHSHGNYHAQRRRITDARVAQTDIAPILKDTTAPLPLVVGEEVLRQILGSSSLAAAAYSGSKDDSPETLMSYATTALRNVACYSPPLCEEDVLAVGFVEDTKDWLPDTFISDNTEMLIILLKEPTAGSAQAVFSFRGTEAGSKDISTRIEDWATDLVCWQECEDDLEGEGQETGWQGSMRHLLRQLTGNDNKVKIHAGFLSAFNSVARVEPDQSDIRTTLDQMMKKKGVGKLTKITCVGHSLGGALATIAAYWCKKVAYKEVEVACYTIGSPRVGNGAFVQEFTEKITESYRSVHKSDPVPRVPPEALGYEHVGQSVFLLDPKLNTYDLTKEELSELPAGEYVAITKLRPHSEDLGQVADHDIDTYIRAIESALAGEDANLPKPPSTLTPAKKKKNSNGVYRKHVAKK